MEVATKASRTFNFAHSLRGEAIAAMPLLKRKRVLAAAIETTIGTAEALDAGDAAFNVYNPMIQPTIEMEPREGQGGFGYLSSVPAGRIGTATFRTNLEWDGTATEPAWADTFFPACGWVKSGQVYTPRSEAPGTNVKTLTIGCYVDGVFKSIAGAVGKFTVTLPTGKMGYIDWEFQGVLLTAPTDVALIAPTYPTVKPLRFAGGLAEWNDVNLCVSQATIDSGNEIVMRECPTTDAGFISGIITDRKPKITVDPEAVTVATQDRWGAWLAMTEYALELDLAGPAGGSSDAVLSFDAPKAQIINLQEADRGKLVTDQLEFACNKNGATHDQELSITFTALVA